MIKNSILGKLCPVFHLRSAAVASLQNLNHWLVWSGTVPRCDSEEEHTLVGGWDMEEARRAVARGEGVHWCGGSVVENYTTTINHFYTTVFFPLPQFLTSPIPTLVLCLFLCFFLYLKAVHLLLLICTPTLTVPLAFRPLFFFQSLAMFFIRSTVGYSHFPILYLSQLHLHCGLFTCFLY